MLVITGYSVVIAVNVIIIIINIKRGRQPKADRV